MPDPASSKRNASFRSPPIARGRDASRSARSTRGTFFGVKPREARLASQLDEIGIMFLVGPLQPLESPARVVGRAVDPGHVVRRDVAMTALTELPHKLFHGRQFTRGCVRLCETRQRLGATPGVDVDASLQREQCAVEVMRKVANR